MASLIIQISLGLYFWVPQVSEKKVVNYTEITAKKPKNIEIQKIIYKKAPMPWIKVVNK